jgi:hypothetical protein
MRENSQWLLLMKNSSQWLVLMAVKFKMALALGREVPPRGSSSWENFSVALDLRRDIPCGSCSWERSYCESYFWQRSSSQWLLLLGEKFLVNLTLGRGVPPSGSCSWERSSL